MRSTHAHCSNWGLSREARTCAISSSAANAHGACALADLGLLARALARTATTLSLKVVAASRTCWPPLNRSLAWGLARARPGIVADDLCDALGDLAAIDVVGVGGERRLLSRYLRQYPA